MRFRFPLEAVLRVRRIREEQQRGVLLAANAQAERLRQQLAGLEQALAAQALRRARALAVGASGAELQFETGCRQQAMTLRRQLQQQLHEAGLRRQQAQEQFLTLRRDRRLVEALSERWQREFERQQQKREEALAGEIYLLRRGGMGRHLPSD